MKRFYFGTLLLLVGFSSFAQPYGDSKYKQKLTKADALIFNGAFAEALPLLEELHATDTSIANVNFLLGICHLNGTKNYLQAIRFFENASRDVSKDYTEVNWKERKAPGLTYLYLGRAYHYLNQFDKAVSNYYNYRSFIDIDDLETYNKVRMVIKHAENAMELIKVPVNVDITNLGATINSVYSDYSPIISAGGEILIFTSRRPGGTSDAKDKDGSYFDDIYVSKRSANDTWGKPMRIGGGINTVGHEAAIGISPDGQTLFIYKDDNGDGNIYRSDLKESEWSAPVKMESNINTSSWETHVAVSHQGDMLVFTSNRTGGYGVRDLWYCLRLPDGSWGLAQSMGSVVNTQFEEDSPFLAFDGKTLFFSSQGHTSMGGFDIFRSEFVEGAWTEPENLGYPINTAEDEVFFVLAADGETAYYSSRKVGGFGDTDLYTMRLNPKQADVMTVAKGQMLVPAMNYVNLKASIVVRDAAGNDVGNYLPNQYSGYYILLLNPGEKYTVEYRVQGYESIVKQISVDENTSYNKILRPVDLDTVVFGEDLLALQDKKRVTVEETQLAEAKTKELLRLQEESLLNAELDVKKSEEEMASLEKQFAIDEENRKQIERVNELALSEAEEAERQLKEEQAKRNTAESQLIQTQEEIAQKKSRERVKKELEAKARAKAIETARLVAEQQALEATQDPTAQSEETKTEQVVEEVISATTVGEIQKDEQLAEALAKAEKDAQLAMEESARQEAEKIRIQNELSQAQVVEEARIAADELLKIKQEEDALASEAIEVPMVETAEENAQKELTPSEEEARKREVFKRRLEDLKKKKLEQAAPPVVENAFQTVADTVQKAVSADETVEKESDSIVPTEVQPTIEQEIVSNEINEQVEATASLVDDSLKYLIERKQAEESELLAKQQEEILAQQRLIEEENQRKIKEAEISEQLLIAKREEAELRAQQEKELEVKSVEGDDESVSLEENAKTLEKLNEDRLSNELRLQKLKDELAKLKEEALAKEREIEARQREEDALLARQQEELRVQQQLEQEATERRLKEEALAKEIEEKKRLEAELFLKQQEEIIAQQRLEEELAARKLKEEELAKEIETKQREEAELVAIQQEAERVTQLKMAEEAKARELEEKQREEAALLVKQREEEILAQQRLEEELATRKLKEEELAREIEDKQREEAKSLAIQQEAERLAQLKMAEEAKARELEEKQREEAALLVKQREEEIAVQRALQEQEQAQTLELKQRNAAELLKTQQEEEIAKQLAVKQEIENKLAEEASVKKLEEQKQSEAQVMLEQSEGKSNNSLEAKQDIQGKVDWEAIAKERQLIILAYEKDKRERAKLEIEQQAQKNVNDASSKNNPVQQNLDVSTFIAQNKKLVQENVEMKSQLDEMNAKLDIILVEVRKRNEMAPPVNPYDEEAVSALNSGKKLILQNILFDYNKARLRGSSERELDKLANFLLNNESIKLTISGHTDANGEPDYNLRLSRARAESVQNYLISRGISKNRLKAIGFGQSMPIAKNVDGNGDDNPIGRQLNRRIEINVTEGDAGLIQTKEVEIPD